jgi:hypothetical protein
MGDGADKQLTDLAFRLTGDDRQLVLQAASQLRQWEAWRHRVKAQLDLL